VSSAPGSFLFVTCQLGAEPALKAEVAAWQPTLRFAFSRPGLITFKAASPLPADIQVPCLFARAWGLSLGRADQVDQVAQLAGPQGPLRLHVFERDICKPGDEPEGFHYGVLPAELLKRLEPALRDAGLQLLPSNARANVGDRVLDVVLGQADEPMLVGTHIHTPRHHAFAGGRIPVVTPPESPSRAFGKMEEALTWSGAPVREGDRAVELGSAPGGAALALVRRGVGVWGVDPGAMDERVLAHVGPQGARCVHIPRVMGQVSRAELPRDLNWVVSDVNAAPQVVLNTVERLCGAPRHALMGVLLTMKLDDWKAARHAPRLMERVAALGMVEVRGTQLAGNRLEFHVTGLTALGRQRRDGP
jgi:23S rRNA (cytidine2498-2'-O)-methyltransferase